MLTIFAIPKPFASRFKTIQTNAIRSWTKLDPPPEIILLGRDKGTEDIASELNLRHGGEVERNKYGTPLMPSVFERGEQLASNNLLCYVNADIILTSDFMKLVRQMASVARSEQFLVVGRKRIVDIQRLIDFDDRGWEEVVKHESAANGIYGTYDSDFFLFQKGLYSNIPSFAIGRCFWSQWLIYSARQKAVRVLDATHVVNCIESAHDYSHAVSTGGASRLVGAEFVANKRLFGRCKYYTTLDATEILTPQGTQRQSTRNKTLSLLVRGQYYMYFLLKGTLYPYSLPLILVARCLIAWTRAATSLARLFVGRRRCGPA